MSKIETVKLTLGEKATVFSDSRSKVKILKGQYVEVPKSLLFSKKYNYLNDSLKGGHIYKVSDSEIKEKGLKPANSETLTTSSETPENLWPDFSKMESGAILEWAQEQPEEVISADYYEELSAIEKVKDLRKNLKTHLAGIDFPKS